jgi:hypothetical protein
MKARNALFATLRSLSAATLALVAVVNFVSFNRQVSRLPSPSQDEVVIWENRLAEVRSTLLNVGYPRGAVGFLSFGQLKGGAETPEDNKNWAQARYVMIPWNLVGGTLDAPYVLLNLGGAETGAVFPGGFKEVYRSGDGLILLQRAAAP